MLTKTKAKIQSISKELNLPNLKEDKVFLLILSALSLIYIFPLTLSGVLYDADTARTLSGMFAYSNDARHLADIIFNIITPGNKAVNLFPYTIMVSSLIVSYSGYMILKNFYCIQNNLAKYVFSLSLLINPFFLGNLAFHFDSLPMALSIFFVAMSLIIDRESNDNLKTILSSIFLFMSLCLYQSSLNIYFILGINIYLFRYANNDFKNKDILRFITKTLISLIAYYIFAKATIFGEYQVSRSSLLDFDSSFFSNLFINYTEGMRRLGLVFSSKMGCIFISIYAVCLVTYLYKNHKNLRKLIITFISVILSIFFIYGFHSFFKRPPHYARNYMAFGAFNMIAIGYFFRFDYLKKTKLIILSFLLIYSFGLSAVFSNVSQAQHEHIERLNHQIAIDINELSKGKETVSIGFSRSFPASVEYNNATEGLPILKLLIQRRLTPTWPNYQDFKRYIPNSTYFYPYQFIDKIKENDLSPKISRKNYSIYVDQDKYYIESGQF